MSRARWVLKEIAPPVQGAVILIAIWALVAALTTTSSIPSPSDVGRALVHGIGNGTIPEAALKTMIRLAFSFVAAVVVGTAIGGGLALSDPVLRAARPIVVALQITPFVAWIPIAVAWFGVSERAVVFVAVGGAFPSVTLATISAFRQVPPLLERAGRTLGARGFDLYRFVVFPAALPAYMTGIQQAWGFAWKALMAGELILSAARGVGLGHLLAREAGDLPTVLAVVIVIAVIGVAVEYLVIGAVDRGIRARRGLLVTDSPRTHVGAS